MKNLDLTPPISSNMLFNQSALMPENVTTSLNKTHAVPKNTGDILFDQNENTAQNATNDQHDNQEHQDNGEQADQDHKTCAFKLPEHLKTDDKTLTQFSQLIDTLGIENDKAQMLIDFAVDHTDKHNQSSQQTAQETQQEKAAELIQQAQQDKEFGGMQMNQSMIMAQNALKNLGNDELIDVLEESGLGNHPEIIRLFYRIGKHMNEDQFISTNTGSSNSNKSLADILYSK